MKKKKTPEEWAADTSAWEDDQRLMKELEATNRKPYAYVFKTPTMKLEIEVGMHLVAPISHERLVVTSIEGSGQRRAIYAKVQRPDREHRGPFRFRWPVTPTKSAHCDLWHFRIEDWSKDHEGNPSHAH